MEAKFYNGFVEEVQLDGKLKKRETVLFSLKKDSHTIGNAPFEFEGEATAKHIKEYSSAWKAFQSAVDLELAAKEAVPTPEVPDLIESHSETLSDEGDDKPVKKKKK